MKIKHGILLSLFAPIGFYVYGQGSEVLKTVVVEAQSPKATVFRAAKGQTLVNEDEIKETSPLTLLESVGRVAGVSLEGSQRPLSGNVAIRGFTNERINLSVDSFDITQISDGTAALSTISALSVDPSLVKSFVVSKGGEGVDFGSGAIGGAVTVETKTAKDYLQEGKTSGMAIHSTVDSASHGAKLGLTAYGLVNDVDILGHLSKARYGDVDTGEQGEVNNHSDQLSGRLKVGWQTENLLLQSISAYQSIKVGEMPFRNQTRWAEQPLEEKEQVKRWQQGFYLAAHQNDWFNVDARINYQELKQGKKQRGHLTLRGKTFHFNEDEDAREKKLSFDLGNTVYHGFGAAKGEMTAKLLYDRLGFEQKAFSYDDNKGDTNYGKSRGNNLALSIKENINFADKVAADLGIRYDRYQRRSSNYATYGKNQDSGLSLNTGVSVFPMDWLMLYGRYNEGYRAPNLRELYKKREWRCHWPRKFCYTEPQPNLKPETSKNLEFGFGFKFDDVAFADKLTVKASVYRNNIDDYIATAPYMYRLVDGQKVFASPKEATHRDYSTKNIAKMKSRGAELEVYYQKDHFDADLSYSITRMDTMGLPNFYLGKIEHERQPYLGAPQDTWALTLGYSPNEQLRFAITAKHRFKQKRLPELYLKHGYGENKSTTLDLAMQYKPRFLNDTTVNFSINNVTDQSYKIYPDGDGKEQPGRTFRLDFETRF